MSRRRMSLIFGNDKYEGGHELNSCAKDARDMTEKLKNFGECL